MTIEDRYILVTRAGDSDTLHRNPTEECNTDDALTKQSVDTATALGLRLGGFVRLCKHCLDEPAT